MPCSRRHLRAGSGARADPEPRGLGGRPIGIAFCVFAVVNGVISLKRFWSTDHPRRWMYTAFMFIVFTNLAVALMSDLSRLGGLV